jgi:hypothetical protein
MALALRFYGKQHEEKLCGENAVRHAQPFVSARGAAATAGSDRRVLMLEHFQAKWIRFAVENAAKSNES